jgi:bifunctional non-homologous end joining protein LigD
MAKLAEYRAKRDFQKTPEPDGGTAEAAGSAFVIQKHDASRLHYDLRLELDGVMKSWAVTRGPSLDPAEKRLAVHTEDHPIAYNTFEGTIPKGQYGGGTVLLWDRGRWIPEGDPHKGYAKGHLAFSLEGEKLHGAWHLVRLKKRAREKQESWLLIKSADHVAREPGATDILDEMPLSVASGRTLEAIATDETGPVWDSKTGLAVADHASAAPGSAAPGKPDAPKAKRAASSAKTKTAMPRDIEPCLASLVSHVPSGDNWLHEIKWDGYRLVGFKTGDAVRLATRRGLDWTKRFPRIAAALKALPVETAIIDGEAVVEDSSGLSSFSALQAALSDATGGIADAAILFAFDLLYLDGADLRPLPLADRKARLLELIPIGSNGALRFSEHLEADGTAMARSACGLGLEGVISKRRDRPYRSGRGDDWVKIKCTERQEFVIGGFVPSSASRKAIGSLALGYYEGDRLRYAGRAGTGFTVEIARDLHTRLAPLKAAASPFSDSLTSEERRAVVWVEPKSVAEIEFRGWTGEDRLRHAAFKGLARGQESRRGGARAAERRTGRRGRTLAAASGVGQRPEADERSGDGGRGSQVEPPGQGALGGLRRHQAGIGRVLREHRRMGAATDRPAPAVSCALPVRNGRVVLLPEAFLGRALDLHPSRERA